MNLQNGRQDTTGIKMVNSRFENLNERIGYLEKVVSILLEDATASTKTKLALITKNIKSKYNYNNKGYEEESK